MQNFFSKIKPGVGDGAEGGMPWMKYGSKGAGILAGIGAMFFGIWVVISLSPICIVAGIWQVCAGFLVLTIEAPFCCMFLDFVQKFAQGIDSRPVWQKAALYLVISTPPLFLCFSMGVVFGSGALFALSVLNGLLSIGKNISSLLGSGLIFAASVMNGMQVIGKKAPREEMESKAGGSSDMAPPPPYSEAMKSGLVGNIQGQDVEAARTAK